MSEYQELKHRLARGWNTWNTRSVLSHVLLPEGFALNLGFREYAGRRYLKEALIGRRDPEDEQIIPGLRSYDGRYTELTLAWRGIEMFIQSATDGDDLLLLITPRANQMRPALLVVESGMLWNRPGSLRRRGENLVAQLATREVIVYSTRSSVDEPNIAAQTPYLAIPTNEPVGLATGRSRSVNEIATFMALRKAEHEAYARRYGDLADAYTAFQTCLAWDTIYEPERDRVVSPVSRIWNINWGGYVLFDWDTYFAAYMASLDNRDLAYANAIEITREKTERGFIPNFGAVNNIKSRDRSQPPVGSLVVRELYRHYRERWFLEEIYADLLEWNRWWPVHRTWDDGLLCWGSDPYEPVADAHFELHGVADLQGAAYESGLDNSPMYDDAPYDAERHLMALADVGLNGMYIMDCAALADIAAILGKDDDARELRQRAELFRTRLGRLWDESSGIYLNRRYDTGEFSHRLSPTNFYALLGRVANSEQARRMIAEHFYNPAEFWGEWIIPSIARNDPAYPDQDYWRGRIWAPMNLLVYLGLRNYPELYDAQRDLAAKSAALLLSEWRAHGHVHENYNGNTGEGCDKPNSDRFYHWGGLLGLIALIEQGDMAGPESPLV